MLWSHLIVVLSVATVSLSVNRPVYKIVLKQKGYTQFLQYDIETPPIREFTFCVWIRIYDLVGNQSIFTYVANSNGVVRLWLDLSRQHIKVSINGRVSSSPVDVTKDAWRHICLTYQSDYGAWAIYLDSHLVSCQASHRLTGFILPGGGSIILGYGTSDGSQSGLEGEIFGANMILVSTIERNNTIKNNPLFEQKHFHNNKMKLEGQDTNYVILSDLQTGEIVNTFKSTQFPSTLNASRSFIKFRTPHSTIEHPVGLELTTRKSPNMPLENDNPFLGFVSNTPPIPELDQTFKVTDNPWEDYFNSKFYKPQNSNTNGQPTLSEYETPPPPSPYIFLGSALENEPLTKSTYNNNQQSENTGKKEFDKKNMQVISEVETPPPVDKKVKVYGQWTSSQFASSVLNYLKSFQSRGKEPRKVLQTIPLKKISDNFPYASDLKIIKVRPPPQFQRRNLVEKQFDKMKKVPQINIQILEDDLRNNILKTHAQTRPRDVEIAIRGRPKKTHNSRLYRNTETSAESEESLEIFETTPASTNFLKSMRQNKPGAASTAPTNTLISVLPFIKNLENLIRSSEAGIKKEDDVYTESLSHNNKWHNVKSFNKDHKAREINLDTDNGQSNLNEKIVQAKKRFPSVHFKYEHENENNNFLEGRMLAKKVSKQSNHSKNTTQIFKYNHGFLPGHETSIKSKHNFDEQVKIGNALNERHVIGNNEAQNILSFVGGDEAIPDINKYRSDIDGARMETLVPGSLVPRICKSIELLDRVLYVQPDEGINMTPVISPLISRNVGMDFVIENYKKCSLEDSELRNNRMLYIDWNTTPVKLFGGAYAKKTTDLCGFF